MANPRLRRQNIQLWSRIRQINPIFHTKKGVVHQNTTPFLFNSLTFRHLRGL